MNLEFQINAGWVRTGLAESPYQYATQATVKN